MKRGPLCCWLGLSLVALVSPSVLGAGLTSEQLFNFAPLPNGSLPFEAIYTLDIRACIFSSVQKSLANISLSDSQISARFLRLIFHDCASGGCNGSIMKLQEQKAFVNTFLSGYDKVEIVKAAAEASCGTTLSYADTIVAGGTLGIYLSGGPNFTQYVRLGRADTDGVDDPNRLPSAFTLNDVLISIFAGLGFNVEELVALSGAHTIGKATCANITPRIASDPYASPTFLYGLTNQCRTLLQQLSMDLSPNTFDNNYYKTMQSGNGILQTDEGLYFENTTTAYASHFALNQTDFFNMFTVALLKMSLIGLRPPSVSNLSAGVDYTMPINASIILNGTASSYLFEIEDLQAALDVPFSTLNSQVVITSILPVLGNSSTTNITFSIVPLPINYNGTIPFQEALGILAALNATAARPSTLQLNNSLWGPVQALQILASPLTNGSAALTPAVTSSYPLATFTLSQTLAMLQLYLQTLTTQTSRALGLTPSETLNLTLSNPAPGSVTLVSLSLSETGLLLTSTAGQQRMAQLQSTLQSAVGNRTLVNATQFGLPGNLVLAPLIPGGVAKASGIGNDEAASGLLLSTTSSASSVPLGPLGIIALSTLLLSLL